MPRSSWVMGVTTAVPTHALFHDICRQGVRGRVMFFFLSVVIFHLTT